MRQRGTPTYDIAADRYDALTDRLLAMPASTLDGVLAKARAFGSMFRENEEIVNDIKKELDTFGSDDRLLAFGLARDLLRLARAPAP